VADEIKLRVKLSLLNGNLAELFDPGEISITQTTGRAHCPVINVGTTEEVLSLGDITAGSEGYVAFRNLDTTNYVQIGVESAGAMVASIRLAAGGIALFPMEPSKTWRAKANTAAVNLQMKLFQA
jgi:hypothetical protein